ncbi:MAG: hypothetical protein H0U92_00525 [Actinobacteria bacterium]|nr:hypothetical protein [Actinomycetota bacterium]
MKVGETCTITVETAEAAGQYFSSSRNCHAKLQCAGVERYGVTGGFFPCVVVEGVPLHGADTMTSSADGDPALWFDLRARKARLRDDAFMIEIALGSKAVSPPPPGARDSEAYEKIFSDVRARHWASGHAKMASPYRAAYTIDDFRRAVEANSLLLQHTAAAVAITGACDGLDIGRCASGGLTTPSGKVKFDVAYVIEEGASRVMTLSVAGVPVLGVGIAKLPDGGS